MTALIYHIAPASAWPPAGGVYDGTSLADEGFIHASTAAQLLPVADRLFAGRTGLVVLAIDPDRVGVPVVYENTEGGSELFPHLYGPLDPAAVVATAPLEPGPDGRFTWPAALPTPG